jgi:translation initiation factor 2 gamma subunit (eIF-2gamma)
LAVVAVKAQGQIPQALVEVRVERRVLLPPHLGLAQSAAVVEVLVAKQEEAVVLAVAVAMVALLVAQVQQDKGTQAVPLLP